MCETIDNKNCIEKYNIINEVIRNSIQHPNIFLVPYKDHNEYDEYGNVFTKISYYNKFNFLHQGSNFGYFSNLHDITNNPVDVFCTILHIIITYEKYFFENKSNNNMTEMNIIELYEITKNIIITIFYSTIWNKDYRNLILQNLGFYNDTIFSNVFKILRLLNVDENTTDLELYNKIINSINLANNDIETKKKYDKCYDFLEDVFLEEIEFESYLNNSNFKFLVQNIFRSFNQLIKSTLDESLLSINGYNIFFKVQPRSFQLNLIPGKRATKQPTKVKVISNCSRIRSINWDALKHLLTRNDSSLVLVFFAKPSQSFCYPGLSVTGQGPRR